ncbi:MAG: ABC transporter ATP-binding protein [Gemmatimonadetes bacterium]|nr:ABC transporter ATP-binding protein [Gemmatimonadota bacterium]
MSALELSDVWFSYATEPVIRGVSLSISPGETVALLGPNGAGKTTITKLIMGLLHPSRGEILVAGVPNMDRAPEDLARHAAYVFQHPDRQLFARTVIDEVAFGPRQFGRPEHEAIDAAFHALLGLGIEGRAAEHPYDLPPAERKLVTLAAALAQDPRVLVLDEPTQGLDAIFRDRVCEMVGNAAKRNVAVLAVSHDATFVAEATARAILMANGTVVGDLSTRELLADEERGGGLGVGRPPAARLSRALGLPRTPVRKSEVAEAVRARLTTLR